MTSEHSSDKRSLHMLAGVHRKLRCSERSNENSIDYDIYFDSCLHCTIIAACFGVRTRVLTIKKAVMRRKYFESICVRTV